MKHPDTPGALQAERSSNLTMRRVHIWLKRIGRGLVIGVVTLALIGAAYQFIATEIDQRRYPPPGQMVDVGGRRLHIYCTGANTNGSPTVILESGLGGTSSVWARMQPDVAKAARVCAYDRAGVGWSDPSRAMHNTSPKN